MRKNLLGIKKHPSQGVLSFNTVDPGTESQIGHLRFRSGSDRRSNRCELVKTLCVTELAAGVGVPLPIAG